MLDKNDVKDMIAVLKDKDTDAVCLFSCTGDKDQSYVTNCDHVDASWDMVRVMMNMLVHEFTDPEHNMLVLTRFLNKLGYFPTKEQVEMAYEAFLAPVKNQFSEN